MFPFNWADGSPLLSRRRLYAVGLDGDRAHCTLCGGSHNPPAPRLIRAPD